MQRLEDLNLNGLKIYQDDSLYCFTSDAVLLSHFASVKKGDRVADFCSGSAIVSLNLYGLNDKKIDSVTLFEMQKPLYDLSVKSIDYNALQHTFTAVNCKVQEIDKRYNEYFSLIVCNPPYMELGRGQIDENPLIATCKSEVAITLLEVVENASRCLKFGGRFCMVHRADRLVDAITVMRQHKLEPKRLQFISGGAKHPYLFLIEGVKGAKPGLKVLKEKIN